MRSYKADSGSHGCLGGDPPFQSNAGLVDMWHKIPNKIPNIILMIRSQVQVQEQAIVGLDGGRSILAYSRSPYCSGTDAPRLSTITSYV